jgi:hypothetical protein
MKFAFYFFVSCVFLITLIFAQRTRNPRIDCSVRKACHPWLQSGPACARGWNMNLQFFLDLAPENHVVDFSPVYNLSEVTYAFCPRVDEIQAFNLTNAFKLAGTFYNDSVKIDNKTIQGKNLMLSEQLEVGYLSVYGMGDVSDIYFPNPNTSYGSVGVIFNTTDCNDGEFGIVNFLVVNITMKNGKYIYGYDNMTIKTGFSPTCNAQNMCTVDPSMKCLGEPGKANCGMCVSDPEIIANTILQVWVSYYGTDSSGRKFMSGASNPLNYRAFSGGGMYRAFRRAESRWNGEITEDDLQP